MRVNRMFGNLVVRLCDEDRNWSVSFYSMCTWWTAPIAGGFTPAAQLAGATSFLATSAATGSVTGTGTASNNALAVALAPGFSKIQVTCTIVTANAFSVMEISTACFLFYSLLVSISSTRHCDDEEEHSMLDTTLYITFIERMGCSQGDWLSPVIVRDQLMRLLWCCYDEGACSTGGLAWLKYKLLLGFHCRLNALFLSTVFNQQSTPCAVNTVEVTRSWETKGQGLCWVNRDHCLIPFGHFWLLLFQWPDIKSWCYLVSHGHSYWSFL